MQDETPCQNKYRMTIYAKSQNKINIIKQKHNNVTTCVTKYKYLHNISTNGRTILYCYFLLELVLQYMFLME